MVIPWESIVNLIFCLIILGLGIYAFKVHGAKAFLLIGLGFLMFGISHFFKIIEAPAGFKIAEILWLNTLLIVVRMVGYLLVITALLISTKR